MSLLYFPKTEKQVSLVFIFHYELDVGTSGIPQRQSNQPNPVLKTPKPYPNFQHRLVANTYLLAKFVKYKYYIETHISGNQGSGKT